MINPRSSLVIVIRFDFTSGAKSDTAFFLAMPSERPFSTEGRALIVFPKSDKRPAERDMPPVVVSVWFIWRLSVMVAS